MDPLIDGILQRLKDKHGISKYDLEKILDSQFKVLQLAIEQRDLREVNIMHIGKFKPTKWFKENKCKYKDGKFQRDNSGVVQSPDIKEESV